MDCPNLGGCPFFQDKMGGKPAVSQILKRQYCQGDYQSCARYKVKEAAGSCPGDLWPNQQEKIGAIVGAK